MSELTEKKATIGQNKLGVEGKPPLRYRLIILNCGSLIALIFIVYTV